MSTEMVNPEEALEALNQASGYVPEELAVEEDKKKGADINKLMVDQGVEAGMTLSQTVAENQKIVRNIQEEEEKEIPTRKAVSMVTLTRKPKGAMIGPEGFIAEADVSFSNGMIVRCVQLVKDKMGGYRFIYPVIRNLRGNKVSVITLTERMKKELETAVVEEYTK